MRTIITTCLVVLISTTAFGSVLNLSVGDTVNAKIDGTLVSPLVGGVTISLDGTTYGAPTADVPIGNDAVWIGCYLFDIEGMVNNYKTFCMDVLDQTNQSYTQHTAYTVPASLESMWGTYYDEVVNDAVKAGAFQLAVWEIVHDDGSDVATGDFHLVSLDLNSQYNNGATYQGLIDQANAYLNSSNWTAQANLVKLDDGTNQPFPVEVPEPATLGLLMLGGLMLRRRK